MEIDLEVKKYNEICKFNSEEFEQFTSENFALYTTSIHYNNRSKTKGDVHLVGVKDDQEDVIAALINRTFFKI